MMKPFSVVSNRPRLSVLKNAGLKVEGATFELYDFTVNSEGLVTSITKVLIKVLK